MNTESLKKWEPEAWALPGPVEGLRAPFSVMVGEATDCARFVQRYMQPGLDGAGQEVRPGLDSAVGTGQFTASIAEDTLELLQALQTAQTHYQLLVQKSNAAPVDRARYVLSEIREVLSWFFDDGVDDESDIQLAGLATKHDKAASHDDIASALYDYAELAERHQEAINGVGGFNAEVIAEARSLADALRDRSAGPATVQPLPGTQQALELRNRVGMLLYDRMHRIRTAGRFVFRRHPSLIREVTSDYFRKQRLAHLRSKEAESNQEAPVNPDAPTQEIPAVAPAAPPGE